MAAINNKVEILKANIIKFLYLRKVLSITDLSTLTGKSLPVVASAVNSLIESGKVIEKGVAPSTGGRRPAIFLLNPDYKKFVVTVAMDQLTTRFTIYDLAQNMVVPEVNLEFDIANSKNDVTTLINFINQCIDGSAINRSDIIGIGIGMPGFTNPVLGINLSYFPMKNGVSLKDYLAREIGLPVSIDNDSSLIALAELNFGEARGLKDVMVVNIGWGTGLGMIINGKLYRGSSGYAGEFSHIPLSESKNLCSCGKRGCLEVDTSLLVMTDKATIAMKGGAESRMEALFKDRKKHAAEHFIDAVIAQDPLAVSVLSEAGFQLGKGLATLIHIMNPECIVLSGRGARTGKMILPSIQQAINEFSIAKIAKQTTVKLSSLTHEAELLAAASLVVEHQSFL